MGIPFRYVNLEQDPTPGSPFQNRVLQIPTTTTAARPDAAAAINGSIYYDTTADTVTVVVAGAYANLLTGAAAATSLDGAYDFGGAGAGRTITVDSGDVELNLAVAGSSLELDSSAAGVTVTDALFITTSGAGAVITDAIDASDAGIVNAINIGANDIAGTNFSVNGGVGSIVCVGIANTGATTTTGVTAVAAGAALALDGNGVGGVTINGTGTGAITLTRATTCSATLQVNGAFTLDTADFTSNGGNASWTVTTAVGDGFLIDGSTVTTGNVLRLEYDAALSGAGFGALSITEDGVEIFVIGEDGTTTIAGTASGTDALTLTAGDILITSGNFDMTLGNATLTNGNLTLSAGGLDVTPGAGDGDAFDLVNLAASPALDLDMAAASVNAGGIIDIDGSTGSAPIVAINMAGAYTGDYVALNMTNAVGAQAINITGAGVRTVSLIEIADTPEGAGANTLDLNITPGAGTTALVDIDIAGAGAANVIDLAFAAAYTGDGLTINMTNAVGAQAINLTGAGVRTVSLVEILDTPEGAGANTIDLNVTPGAGTLAIVDIDIAGVQAADVIGIDFAAAYTGDGINITMTNAAATAQALVIDGGQVAATVNVVSITSSSAFAGGTGRLMYLQSSGAVAVATSGIVLDVAEAGAVQATSYAVRINSTNNEALHVDSGVILVDESLSVVGTAATVGRGPNYIAAGGANNIITGTLNDVSGTAVPLADGLMVLVDLQALTLQAGANTFNLNAGGALSIVSHNNIANNIGTAYAAQSHVLLCYNAGATAWEDMSQ